MCYRRVARWKVAFAHFEAIARKLFGFLVLRLIGAQLSTITAWRGFIRAKSSKALSSCSRSRLPLAGFSSDSSNVMVTSPQQAQQPEAPAQPPPTIQLGQSIADVKNLLGAPTKMVDLGAKQIYIYKDMKVTFIRGKVVDVQ